MRPIMRVLSAIENWVLIGSFIVIVAVTFINIATRYIAETSLAFTEEISINLLVVLTMMGAVVALRERAHLGFTYLIDIAGPKAKPVLVWASTVMVVAFLAVLAIYGGEMLVAQAGRGRSTPSLQIPQWIFTLSIPIAGLLGIFHAIVAARQTLSGLGGDSGLGTAMTAVALTESAGESNQRLKGRGPQPGGESR